MKTNSKGRSSGGIVQITMEVLSMEQCLSVWVPGGAISCVVVGQHQQQQHTEGCQGRLLLAALRLFPATCQA